MEKTKRRAAMIELLALRRYETVDNLARELGVSTRTVRRDLEVLSLTEPIYTKSGRHYGGVYMMDGKRPSRTYRQSEKAALIRTLYENALVGQTLSAPALNLLGEILKDYEQAPFLS